MQILSDIEREALLKTLSNAPDEVLLDAVYRVKERHLNIQKDMKEVNSFVGLRVVEASAPRFAASAPPPPVKSDMPASEAAPRKDVSPGPSSIGKIGTKTKEALFEGLKDGTQPSDKWSEHLKLLWQRHEVKFDGVKYYL